MCFNSTKDESSPVLNFCKYLWRKAGAIVEVLCNILNLGSNSDLIGVIQLPHAYDHKSLK